VKVCRKGLPADSFFLPDVAARDGQISAFLAQIQKHKTSAIFDFS